MSQTTRIELLSHLAADGEETGAERSLLSVGLGLRQAGRAVRWLSPDDGRSVVAARAAGLDVQVRPWPRLWLTAYHAGNLGSVARLARFFVGSPRLLRLASELRGRRSEVALVNTLANLGAAWAAHRAGLPVVVRVAEIPGPGWRRQLLRAGLARVADRIVAVSHAVAAALGDGLPVVVVHSGIELPAMEQVAADRRSLRRALALADDALALADDALALADDALALGDDALALADDALALADDALVVGHVGQLQSHKGQGDFVAAVVGVAAPTVCAVLAATAGKDQEIAALRATGRALGDRLRFPGFVPGGPRGLDLLVFTSTVPDPFPRVVLEAMAAGVPVVAYRDGGVPEAVVDGVTGLLVPSGDRTALAAAVSRLIADPGLRQRLGAAARADVQARFPAAGVADRYGAILDEVARR